MFQLCANFADLLLDCGILCNCAAMAPRPNVLEEPDFSKLENLALTTFWDRQTGFHGWSRKKFADAVASEELD